ncbi:dihydropteroate synthase [Aliiglaciecola sp. 2_MG-2023]|uniref:dihydropteroate synthase n=1 Tax=unclassified Aliiglaciecola TaxID=2593648 RepID=UPI0026E48425|nr:MULTISPECIES: dihydropteroate synthase [unclassified Aliiglaciecola]MDO6710419.1 dihydropteroate synthase [Aliiglaciecola sp. 2_MG-2023]MDO6751716.1 dihydropteroate synthase [Aliiglaciecola sp. 1_MG-2023]
MQFKDKHIDLTIPRVMGILNVTPDSFSDGGKYVGLDNALTQAEIMISAGADFIDVGGESTRPGAQDVSVQQELDRTIPVIEAIHANFDVVVSIDTSKPQVMKHAVDAGAGLINDIRALSEEGAIKAAAKTGAAICLMHMQGQPRNMQQAPTYDDVVRDVMTFLQSKIELCLRAGIPKSLLMIDPGFGFGKTLPHNYQILDRLEEMKELDLPMLIGVSRKSMIGNLLDREVDERLAGSIAAATIALTKGASILRVHDVKQTVDAVKVVLALSAYKD